MSARHTTSIHKVQGWWGYTVRYYKDGRLVKTSASLFKTMARLDARMWRGSR